MAATGGCWWAVNRVIRRNGKFMNYPLYQSLHARGLTQAKLAALTGINRSVLARILTNEPGRGKETRAKIIQHLSHREIRILGWTKDARAVNQQLEEEMNAPRWSDCRGPCAMCSTSNIVPAKEAA